MSRHQCGLGEVSSAAYVSIRLHASAYVCIRLHTSAYVCMRLHASACVSIRLHTSACVSIRQHASAYVSMCLHASACVCMRQHTSAYLGRRLCACQPNGCGASTRCTSSRVSMRTFVPVKLQLLTRQYVYFCTSKASKLSTVFFGSASRKARMRALKREREVLASVTYCVCRQRIC